MKLLHVRMAFALVAVISIGLSASAQILIDENFDSYNDDFDMEANWELGDGTLATVFGNTSMDGFDNSANQPIFQPSFTASNITSWIGTSISAIPSATQNVVLTADIYDDGLSSNERATIGFRSGANPLFEMGHYNNPSHFAFRLVNIAGDSGGTNGGWQALTMTDTEVDNTSTEGWHRYQATLAKALWKSHSTYSPMDPLMLHSAWMESEAAGQPLATPSPTYVLADLQLFLLQAEELTSITFA